MSAAIDNNFIIKNKQYYFLLKEHFSDLVWEFINVRGKKREIPDKAGVYICCLTDRETGCSDVYYVGSTVSMRNRMSSHLHIINACKNLTSFDVVVIFAECKNIRGYEKGLHRCLNPIIADGVFSKNGLID